MEKFYNEGLKKLEAEISEIEIEVDISIEKIETIIQLIINCVSDLKEFILNRGFKNESEEIRFFKYLKPTILSKLIYYNTIYKIETQKPHGTKTTKKYLINKLRELKSFFNNNLEFYKYYRTNSTYLDDKLFVRGNHDFKLNLNTYYFESDHRFTTTYDYKLAKIMANDLLQVYIETKLESLNKTQLALESVKGLKWTGSKVALTELIYALHTQHVINNGNIDIKLLARYCERLLDIDLGDYYHTFLEIKRRKINRTKFIDKLREGLNKKIEEQDDN
ncbi:RteC domain-containing protein [Polluticaenibacter yanchengensis]|uniref:RteC domain-containing protein n=1 Tax=Polluticaenibacter yanchengensis TaxID=3014562 RepID=A0ABT4UH27_9BACT|nr:RteC domain-containing protein [Chitinophagaceae bacterium LY-5]